MIKENLQKNKIKIIRNLFILVFMMIGSFMVFPSMARAYVTITAPTTNQYYGIGASVPFSWYSSTTGITLNACFSLYGSGSVGSSDCVSSVRTITNISSTGSSTVSSSGFSTGVAYWIKIWSTTSYDYQGIIYMGTVPTLSNPTATNITVSGATLSATIDSFGVPNFAYTDGICYNTNSTYLGADGYNGSNCSLNQLAEGSGTTSVSRNITGLTANTTYYYRAYATNNGNNLIGYSATASFVALSPQNPITISPTSATYPYSVNLSTSGGNGSGAVTYAVVYASASGCSITGNTLTATSSGYCSVVATKASDGYYAAASSENTNITFNKAPQSTFYFYGQTVTNPNAFAALSTTGGSGTGAVTYAVTTAGAGCSISGNVLSYTSTGSCVVTATKASDVNYLEKTAVATFNINVSSYALIINPSGGNGSGSYGGHTAGNYTSGTSISVTANPSSGSYFTSWSASGSASSCAGSTSTTCSFSLTSGAAVQANYTLYQYTYYFDGNGATGSPSPTSRTLNYGASLSAPTDPTRTGYTFSGWSPSIPATMPLNGGTSYAQWNLIYNTVSTSGSNVTFTPTSRSVGYGSTTTFNVAPASNYHIVSVSGCNGSFSSPTYTTGAITGACTVTAVTAIDTYALSYGTAGNGSTSGSISGTAQGQVSVGAPVTLTAPSASSGSYFAGWSGGLGTCASGTTNPCSFSMPAYGVTVTATYTLYQYTYYFDGNGATGSPSPTSRTLNYGASLSAPTDPTRTGYTFSGWSPSIPATMPLNGGTSYAQWTVVQKYLTVGNDGHGTGGPAGWYNYGTVVTLTASPNAGYYFNYWSGNSDCTDGSVTMTTDVSCTANFAIYQYALTISSSGGNGSGSYGGNTAGNYNYGTSLSVTANPSSGSYFTSWTASGSASSCNGSTSTTCSFSITSNASVQANYTLSQIALTLNTSIGAGSGSYGGSTAGNYNYGTSLSVTANPSAGSYFNSWTASGSASSCNGSTSTTCSFTITSASSLTASYSLYQYTVTFNKNGGETEATPISILTNYNTTVTLPIPPTRTGYAFSSWNTAANGLGSAFTSSTPITGNITVYAIWTDIGITLADYRLYKNTDSTNVGAPMANLNTSGQINPSNDKFRLRFLMKITGTTLPVNGGTFKLQYSPRSGSCDVGFSGESYADVTHLTTIAYFNNFYPEDKIPLTANANDPTHGSDTIVNQSYAETNNFKNSVSAIAGGQYAKWDLSLYEKGTSSYEAYCLRVVNSDGSLLDTYSYIPEVISAYYEQRQGNTGDVEGSATPSGETTGGANRWGGDKVENSGTPGSGSGGGSNGGGVGDLGYLLDIKKIFNNISEFFSRNKLVV